MRWAVLMLCCLAMPVIAQEGDPPPDTSLTPKLRPDDLIDPEVQVPPDDPMGDAQVPEQGDVLAEPVREVLRAGDADHAACLARLEAHGTVFEQMDEITDPDIRDCGIARPIELSEIVPGVRLAPSGVMRCDTALALANWTAAIVMPAAKMLPDRGALTQLDHGSAYICRTRNNAPGGKISEHGFGNAVDIMSFQFAEGAPIRVEPREREGTMAEAFQRTVRAGACLYFTTVLGPGTDAAHANHLHMDIKSRNGGFRLCQ